MVWVIIRIAKWRLADKGNGNYAYIDSQLEADKVLVQEMTGTLYTIAKDVKIQIEFNPATVQSYRLLGYENRLLKDWEFNDDSRDAGEIGAGHSVTALYEVEYYTTPTQVLQDSLKYQTSMTKPGFEHEILTVKFRYKRPMETTSHLLIQTLDKTEVAFESASENLRFAATVAGFGMILRNSPNKGNATLDLILAQVKNCRNYDADGHRAEFMNLVKATQSLMVNNK
jgi:Ca-activated chloride channel family protein